MRDDRSRLRDIIRAVDRIAEVTSSGRTAFAQDAKSQVWVIYHLQIIGEASRSLSRDFRERFSDPVWAKVIGLRNVLVHQYFEIDEELIWQVVDLDLPQFRRIIEATLQKLDDF